MDQTKRVFLLGAGSSMGHTGNRFPSIKGFFESAKNIGINLNGNYKEIVEYIQKNFGQDITDPADDKIDIEDIFTTIEIELEREATPGISVIRVKLLELIQNVLLKLENPDRDESGDYNVLCDEHNKILRDNDTIITFNWDLLLDNILGREIKLIQTYGFPKTAIRPDKTKPQYDRFADRLSARFYSTWAATGINPPYTNWDSSLGYYLKLHGSIDWFYCSNETCNRWYKLYPLLKPLEQHFCFECHERMDFLLIPPVLNKGYKKSPFIRRIWSLAAREIKSATELIIWGYSLPATDFYSRWLIRQARDAPLTKISIINPSAFNESIEIQDHFVTRFSEIFRNTDAKDNITPFKDFRSYVASMQS